MLFAGGFLYRNIILLNVLVSTLPDGTYLLSSKGVGTVTDVPYMSCTSCGIVRKLRQWQYTPCLALCVP